MKKLITLVLFCTLVLMPAAAQTSRTATKMLYHGGPVLVGVQNVYFIWYGCWTNSICGTPDDANTMKVVGEFVATIGNTPYMAINSTYTDASGRPASAALVWAGEIIDSSYAHGVELTDSDIQGIIYDAIINFRLPQDPQGIYVVVASPDIASNATGFCTPGAPPHHGSGVINGGLLRYIFLGHPNRCKTVAGPQFSGTNVPTPHNNFAGDVLASNLAHAFDATLTDPYGSSWFDRYGLENADKCQNTFGQTFLTANGARANIRLGSAGDYLIQQNWVNDRKARCAMFQ